MVAEVAMTGLYRPASDTPLIKNSALIQQPAIPLVMLGDNFFAGALCVADAALGVMRVGINNVGRSV